MTPSLVLITVDCLRADHVGFLGYHRKTTPFLDTLAESSTVFSNAIVGGAPTYYSFPAIMASRHPLALGRDVIGIAPEEPTLASELSQSGYATAAFLAANPYLSPRFGYEAGFDTFHDFLGAPAFPAAETGRNLTTSPLRSRFNSYLAKTCHGLGPIGGIYDELYFRYCQAISRRPSQSLDSLRRFPSADVIVNEASTWVEKIGSEPFFLWLHFMDPHSPYYPKEVALRWMANDSDAVHARYANSYWNREDIGARRLQRRRGEVVTLYDAGIRWVDSQIDRLVEKLRRQKLWDNCVFAVTADHGEEFLEHGGRYHSPAKLTEELIRVPLLLHGSKASGQKIHSEPFSLIDLAPTLLDALGIPAPATFRGTSLWAQSREAGSASTPAVVESVATCKNPLESEQRAGPRILAIREPVFKLVIDFASSENNLFNLRSDPGELHPLPVATEKPVRRRLLERARAHMAQSIRCRETGQRLDAQLRSLRLECGDPVANISASMVGVQEAHSTRPQAPIRILVDSLADEGLTNAQMTNAREIMRRLDPSNFHVSTFHINQPDPVINSRPNTTLIRLPKRGQTIRILREFVFGRHQILFYMKAAPASKCYLRLRRKWKDHRITIGTIESQSDVRNEPTIRPEGISLWEQTILRCDFLFSNSQAVKRSLQSEYGLFSEIVETGVDTKFFTHVLDRQHNFRIRVLFAGSLHPFKQPDLVLKAAQQFPQADFAIAGDGIMAEELSDAVQHQNLANVFLLGPLTAEALRKEYQRADIFLFPSKWEGSPKVILEAAASGLPVLARKDYNPETVINGETGYLVGCDDELYARLRELLDNASLRRAMGAAGRVHSEKFDWDLITLKWESIFLRLASQKQAAA